MFKCAPSGPIMNFELRFTGSAESQNHADYKNMIRNHRGGVAGIAGYVRDANISNCTNYGPIARCNAGIAGGIVAVATNTTVSNCTTTCTLTGGTGSGFASHSGGIAAILLEESTIDGCSFFGTINTAAKENFATYAGGISGYTADECVIKNCRIGGSINDVTITKDNALQNVAHVPDTPDFAEATNATIENCSYWDGN